MLLLFGVSLLLVTGVFVSIILSSQERIAELERSLEYNRVRTVNPMTRWENDAVVAARHAYLTRGWIPAGCKLFEVRVEGMYTFVAGVVAANQVEAIEKLKLGLIAYGTTPENMHGIPEAYGGWCDNGYDAFMSGLAALRVDQPVYDPDFESVGVLREYPVTEPVRTYAFKLEWNDTYEGGVRHTYTASVQAAGLYGALEELLDGREAFRSDTDSPVNAAYNDRAAVALAMLTPHRCEWSYAFLGHEDLDTAISYEVVSDPVTEPVAA